MRQRRTWAVTLLAIMCLTLGSVAHAQSEPEPTEEARKEASEHFLRGVELFQEGAFRAALVEFERAYGIAPDYRLLYNIGQVKLQLGDYLGATQSYERYLAEGGDEVTGARRKEVRSELKILNDRVGRLSITCNVRGAELFVDDQQVGITPLLSSVVVNVGQHRVFARAKNGAVASEVVDVAGGDSRKLHLDLKDANGVSVVEEVEAEPAKPWSTQKKLAIGSLSVGSALLITAIITGVMAKGKVDDRKSELKRDLPDQDKLEDLSDSGSTLSLTTDVIGALALAGVGTGVVLWMLDARKKPEAQDKQQARSSARLSVGFGNLSIRGSF